MNRIRRRVACAVWLGAVLFIGAARAHAEPVTAEDALAVRAPSSRPSWRLSPPTMQSGPSPMRRLRSGRCSARRIASWRWCAPAIPSIYRPTSVIFSASALGRGRALSRACAADRMAAAALWLATYRLERQPDKSWRISGCDVQPSAGKITWTGTGSTGAMSFLAIDIGNTRLEVGALCCAPQPGAGLLGHGAIFLEAIDDLAEREWKGLPPPASDARQHVVAGEGIRRRAEAQLEAWDVEPRWIVSSASACGVDERLRPPGIGSASTAGSRSSARASASSARGRPLPVLVVLVGTAVDRRRARHRGPLFSAA